MSTITSLQTTDNGANSREIINTNFTNLNTDKLETSGGTLSGQLNFSGTTHAGVKLLSLTTSQRDALSPANGMIIYNTTTAQVEFYQNGAWTATTGSPDMDTTTKGVGEQATTAEIDAGTDVGSTSAHLVVTPDKLKASTYYTSLPSTDQKAALAGTSGTPSVTNKYVTNDDVASTATASKVVRANSSGNLDSWINGFKKSLTAGETITGATLPVPVYYNPSTAKVYSCDGNDLTKLLFFGFATTTGNDTESITVYNSGVVSGFTGLTTGAYYYLSDTVGTISVTPGTYRMLVGQAVSTTEILIIKPAVQTVASDVLQASANTSRSFSAGGYAKYKEIQYNDVGGVVRVKFTLTETSNGIAYGRIYKNGVAYGTERTTTEVDTVFTEDLTFEKGDLIQFYGKYEISNGAVSDFQIYYSKELSTAIPTVVTN